MTRHSLTLSVWTTLERSEIWTAVAGAGYVDKPRPVAIVQDDHFDATGSVTVCAFTTDPTEAPLFRLRIEPDDTNGLRESCNLIVDKTGKQRPARQPCNGANMGRYCSRRSRGDRPVVRLGPCPAKKRAGRIQDRRRALDGGTSDSSPVGDDEVSWKATQPGGREPWQLQRSSKS